MSLIPKEELKSLRSQIIKGGEMTTLTGGCFLHGVGGVKKLLLSLKTFNHRQQKIPMKPSEQRRGSEMAKDPDPIHV